MLCHLCFIIDFIMELILSRIFQMLHLDNIAGMVVALICSAT